MNTIRYKVKKAGKIIFVTEQNWKLIQTSTVIYGKNIERNKSKLQAKIKYLLDQIDKEKDLEEWVYEKNS